MRVVLGIVVRGSEVLLVREKGDSWTFPGGEIEEEEQEEYAVIRKVLEETGIICKPEFVLEKKKVGTAEVSYWVCEYVCEATEGKAESTWIRGPEALEMLATETLHSVKEFLNSLPIVPRAVYFTIKEKRVFEALVNGEKSWEGRLAKEPYSTYRSGDYALFFLENSPLTLLISRIVERKEFSSVEVMVKELWRGLIPWASNEQEALEYYSRIYDIKKPAVAFRIRPLARLEGVEERHLKKLGVKE